MKYYIGIIVEGGYDDIAMAKVPVDTLSQTDLAETKNEFRSTLRILEREDILLPFLEHILTQSEQVMLARRIRIAKQLLKGASYGQIERKLHVGQKTIETVHRWLLAFPEYRRVIPKALEKKRGKALQFEQPYSLAWIRRKYPLHFLLINLILGEKR